MLRYFKTFLAVLQNSLFARLGLGAMLIAIALLGSLFYYLTHQAVSADNRSRFTTATLTSQALVDKLDRNFYERFGDVQAFAYNRLAVSAVEHDTVAS
ncbi:MAG: hypothetical protein MUD08_04625, partial [Cytophagales bacterium]|nr:hypothetical protein [Cytophagales bacterium]